MNNRSLNILIDVAEKEVLDLLNEPMKVDFSIRCNNKMLMIALDTFQNLMTSFLIIQQR